MTFHEPSTLEVLLTVAVGTVARSVYQKYVDRLGLQGHEQVLDYGSGAGTPARMLARKLLKGGGQVTCVDISEAWLQTARRRLAQYPNVSFRLGELSSLDLPDAAYDVVFVHFCLHDIPAGQRPHVVEHLARKLAPGGKLFIREPLQQLAQQEIARLMRQTGLNEIGSSTSQVPLMGPAYEGIFGVSSHQVGGNSL